MYELIHAKGNTYYIESPSKVGVFKLKCDEVCLIDSGNNRDMGKRIKKALDTEGLWLKSIYITHAHADHIGGNKYLEGQYGCKIYSPGVECDFTRHTMLMPALLYGANPPAELRHKFLLAEECAAAPLTVEALPDGFEAINLSGHTPSMVGYRTPDDVLFLGDCLSSKEVLDKYGVGYIYDIESYLSTLETVKRLEAALFIPSHTAPTEDISPLAEYNIKKVAEVCECITDICAEPHTVDEIITELFTRYGLAMNFEQYALVGSTVRSYLTYLMDKRLVIPYFNENKLLFERI